MQRRTAEKEKYSYNLSDAYDGMKESGQDIRELRKIWNESLDILENDPSDSNAADRGFKALKQMYLNFSQDMFYRTRRPKEPEWKPYNELTNDDFIVKMEGHLQDRGSPANLRQLLSGY